MSKEIILILFLFLGVAGTLIPFLPGIPLIFFAILIYSFIDNWIHFSPYFLVILGIITCITFFIDYFATYWGVKRFGASKIGLWGGILGTILGILFMGPLGLLLGSFLGVILGELLVGKKFSQAIKISLGNFIGILGSTILQFIIALTILFWAILKLY